MAEWWIMPVLVVVGYFFGYYLEKFFKAAEKISIFNEPLSAFLAETIYFAFLFSVVLSKNITLILLNLAILIYAKTTTYGKEYFIDKPEDRVETKWYPKFP